MFEDFSGKHGEFGFFVCDGGLVFVMVQQGMCGEHQQTCGWNQGNLGNLATDKWMSAALWIQASKQWDFARCMRI